ncbi:MAG: hypothetical protein GF334_13340, partial [Candidatus Altiarchaeales archaeon]|nr:hypothetical protein [Candidatus Altiarchaeales archaeon]
MEVNLLRSIKLRLMDELRYAIQKNLNYKDKVEVYHKFPYKETPMTGVVLRNANSSRTKLSPDDFAGTLKSHVALARAEGKDGRFLVWAWEDTTHLTKHVENEDVSGQTAGSSSWGTNRLFYVDHKPIMAGFNNTTLADNFRQITVTVNGEVTHAEFVDGKRGLFMLPTAPKTTDTVLVSYHYGNLALPGRYYIEIEDSSHFLIDPLYIVKKEEVIAKTTGTELTAQLDNSGLYGDFDVLYTQKQPTSNKLYLTKNTDYTINQAGEIAFLNALPVGTTLYADYRWAGSTQGPFDIPTDYHYTNTAINGVTLAFGNEIEVGDRMVVIVYPDRQVAAQMYSGHFNMSFDLEVFTRTPQVLADLTDHILAEIWNNRRLPLMDEGITIEEMDPGGETEEPYDDNTGDFYYKNT